MIYLLTDAIGTLLDAMVERKVEGIDRLNVHEPLMKKLSTLKKSDEPRMAQAAQYALQSLNRVPDDEGPWEEALRWTGVGLKAVAKVSGGVTKLDISQVIDAGPSLLKLVEGLGKALKSAIDTWEACESLKDLVQAIRNKADKKDWYYALTRSKVFIQIGSYADLQRTIQGLKCCEKSEFWCGLYSQLEKQWNYDMSSRDNIESFIKWTFKDPSWKIAYDRDEAIQSWIGLLADSFRKPQLKIQLPKRKPKAWRKLGESKFLSRQKDTSEPHLKPSYLEGKMDVADDWNLLNDALEKSKSLVFYADAVLAQHYTQGSLLHIKRLSEQDLPMENCYINLSLIEYQDGSGEKRKDDDPFSLYKRLEAEAPKADKDVSLEQLFQVRKLPNKSLGRPSRVLIRGRAGVGKTTLCKKTIHAFLHEQLWREHYDRLIWIPLRNLKRNRGYNSYVALIEEEIFGQVSGKARLWDAFKSKLHDPRTLFLLDGLDEIAGDQENIDTFKSLLNRQNVIITSRPHAAACSGINPYDLEIETVGFLDDQIEAYVDKVCDVPVRSLIKESISQHWMLKGLMRIPIQLDALCFSWEDGNDQARPLTTMTALYQEIEIKLWKKDIKRMSPKKMSDVHDDPSDCRFRAELQRIEPKPFEFLQSIAFLGMYNNVTEFTRHNRDQFHHHFSDMAMTDRVLKETSFLRSSQSSSPNTQVFYFLHLTFQEYFAAWHFVQCWKSNAEIKTLDVNTGKAVSLHPDDFLQREKYNGRFNIMWRFVSGILGMGHKSPEEDIAKLFQQIEMKPRDLLGRVHTQLLMYCLNEITDDMQTSTLAEIRRNVDNQLFQLVLMDGRPDTGGGPELPERILLACLENGDENPKHTILVRIAGRPQISFDMSRQIWQLYKSRKRKRVDPSKEPGEIISSLGTIDSSAACSICRFSTFSSEEVIEILHDTEDGVLVEGMMGLEGRSDPSHEIWKVVADTLLSSRGKVAVRYAWKFKLPEDIVQYLLSQVSAGCDDRQSALRVLATHSWPNKDTFNRFLGLLDDPVEDVRAEVLGALENHPNLSKSLCNRLFQKIQWDSSSSEAAAALSVLEAQQALPPEIVEQMWDFVESKDFDLRGSSYQILHQHGSLHEDIIMKRFAESHCQDRFAIAITEGAYRDGIPPPQALLDHCISIVKEYGAEKLQDIDPESEGPGDDTVKSAVEALSRGRSSVPADSIRTLWEFGDCDKIGERIERMLSTQDSLPDEIRNEILHRILQRIDKSQGHERIKNMYMLTQMSNLPLPDFVIERVADIAMEGEYNALTILLRQPKIPLHFLKPLAALFLSEDTIYHACGNDLARETPDFRTFVLSLGREYWISQFRYLLERCCWENVSCCSQDNQVYVLGPDYSWSASIEQPEQRQHMEAALDAMESDIEKKCGDAWKALGLWSLNRKSFL